MNYEARNARCAPFCAALHTCRRAFRFDEISAHAVPRPQLPLPVAGRPADLVGARNGVPDPRLVRAGRDRLGRAADAVRRLAARRHADRADPRRRQRPHRSAQSPDRHAHDLRHHRHDADDARLRRRAQPGDRAGAGRPDGAGAAVRSRAARRADRRHHAARATDRRDGDVAHHVGFRAHRRRAHRRRPVRTGSAWAPPTS